MKYNAGPRSAWAISVIEEEEEETRRGPWTVEEDMRLIRSINLHGARRWNRLARASGLNRSGKSCRMRWVNYLHPDLKHGHITPDEERLVLELHARWGNRWSRIAKHLPGRTDNEIKNYWRTHLKKLAEADHGPDNSISKEAHPEPNSFGPEKAVSPSSSTVRIGQDGFDVLHRGKSNPRPTSEQTDVVRSEYSTAPVRISGEVNEDRFGLPQDISDGERLSTLQERMEGSDLLANALSQDVSSSDCACIDSVTAMMFQHDEFYGEYSVQAQQVNGAVDSSLSPLMAASPDCFSNAESFWQDDPHFLWNLDDFDHQNQPRP